MLLSDDVQDGLLSDEKDIFNAYHPEELIGIESLHANNFIVALAIVEDGLGKILENIGRIENRHPSLRLPRLMQESVFDVQSGYIGVCHGPLQMLCN